MDEKELQKEAALKEKEKELQALREQMESLSQNLQSRTSEASRTGQEQANKMSNLLAELQNTQQIVTTHGGPFQWCSAPGVASSMTIELGGRLELV